jgi:hypothetical protein
MLSLYYYKYKFLQIYKLPYMKSNKRISAGKRGGTAYRTPAPFRFQAKFKAQALKQKNPPK